LWLAADGRSAGYRTRHPLRSVARTCSRKLTFGLWHTTLVASSVWVACAVPLTGCRLVSGAEYVRRGGDLACPQPTDRGESLGAWSCDLDRLKVVVEPFAG
jgi:hypothetical protein